MKKRLYISRYMHYIEKGGKYFIYNSVNGNKVVVNDSGFRVLEEADGKEYDEEYANDLISTFIEKKILCEEEQEDYYIVQSDEILELVKNGIHISNLRLNVTQGCNLRCSYCFEKNSVAYKDKKNMDFVVAKKAIDVFCGLLICNKREKGMIRFFGGEPLLNFLLIKQSISYLQKTYMNQLALDLVINTNGTLISENMAQYFHDKNVLVIVSLDGMEQQNDKHRLDIYGKGSFKKVDSGLKILALHCCTVNIATVCTDDNIEYLKELVDYVKRININYRVDFRISFSCVHITSAKNNYVSNEQKAAKIVEAIHYARTSGVKCFGGLTHQVFQNMINPNGGRHCVCLGTELSISPDGSIYPCDGLQIKIGDVWNIKKLLSGEKYLDLVKRTCGKEESCKGCPIEYYCAGGCYADFLSNEGKKEYTCRNKAFEIMMFNELVKEYVL